MKWNLSSKSVPDNHVKCWLSDGVYAVTGYRHNGFWLDSDREHVNDDITHWQPVIRPGPPNEGNTNT
jgi:hypothetical protein